MSFSFRQPGNGSLFGPPVIPDNQSFSFGQPSQSGSNPTQLRWTPPTISTSTSDGDSKPNAAQQTSLEDKDEIISLLLPPKSAKNEYIEQQPAKYVFKCMDGDIQIPEYGILRTEFYYQQVKAREVDENGHIYNYKQFPRSSVKYFTDALFGVMPECKDIVETLQLLNFLLFDGQANEGLCMSCSLKLGASSRWSSSLYFAKWNSDEITIGKMHSTLQRSFFLFLRNLISDFGSDFEIIFMKNIWRQLQS